MIITIAGFQNGAGKSTLAQSLDSYQWAIKRQEHGHPQLKCLHLGSDFKRQLQELSMCYELVIVDACPCTEKAFTEIQQISEYLLFPLRPQWQDLNFLPDIDQLLSLNEQSKNKGLISLIQCPGHPELAKKIRAAKALCRTHGLTVLTTITTYNNKYHELEQQGASLIDIDPKGNLAWEIRNLLNELLAKSMGIKFAQLIEETPFNWLKKI
jgi:cellulose biosynthesis protein BcsQ